MQKQVTKVQADFAELAESFVSLAGGASSLSGSEILSQAASLRASVDTIRGRMEGLLAPVRKQFLELDVDVVPEWAQNEPLAVPVLMSVLNDVSLDHVIRGHALSCLELLELPVEAVPSIVRGLADKDFADQVKETLAIPWAATPVIVDALAAALSDPNLAEEAADTLGQIGQAALPAVPALLEALKHNRLSDIDFVLSRIRPRDDKSTITALENMAQEGDAGSRARALKALSMLQNGVKPRAVPYLIEVLKLKDTSVDAMVRAIRLLGEAELKGKLVHEAQEALLALRHHLPLRCLIAYTMLQVSPRAAKKHIVPLLIADLSDADPQVRKDTADVLGCMPPTSGAVEALEARLEDPEETVRHAAVGALIQIGVKTRGVVAALEKALSGDDHLRRQALRTFYRKDIKLPDSFAPLLSQFLDESFDMEMREAATYLLGIMGPGGVCAVPKLLEGLRQYSLSDYSCDALEKLLPHMEEAEGRMVEESVKAHKLVSGY